MSNLDLNQDLWSWISWNDFNPVRNTGKVIKMFVGVEYVQIRRENEENKDSSRELKWKRQGEIYFDSMSFYIFEAIYCLLYKFGPLLTSTYLLLPIARNVVKSQYFLPNHIFFIPLLSLNFGYFSFFASCSKVTLAPGRPGMFLHVLISFI